MGWSLDQQMNRNMEFFSPEAISARKAEDQTGKERLQGTYAQRAIDEERMKGNFAQNAALEKQMKGTFMQNAGLRREVEGVAVDRYKNARDLVDLQGMNQMDALKYQYGPDSLEAKKVGQMGEYQKGILGQGISEQELKKKEILANSLAKARDDAVKLFGDDPKAATAYFMEESKRINQMFPEMAPPPSGAGGWDDKPGAKAAARGAMPDRMVEGLAPPPTRTTAPPPSRMAPSPTLTTGGASPQVPGAIDYHAGDPLAAGLESAVKGSAGSIWDRLNRGSMFGATPVPVSEPTGFTPPPPVARKKPVAVAPGLQPSDPFFPQRGSSPRSAIGPSLAFTGERATGTTGGVRRRVMPDRIIEAY